MPKNAKKAKPVTAGTIKVKLGIINYGILALFLFSSEFMNAIFNNKLDEAGASFAQRVSFAFKPTVVFLFFIFASVLFTMILRYLRPLFSWMKKGTFYLKARTAAIRIPWTILIFQVVAWTTGTTLYYAINGFQAESGIPYIFGLLLKVAVGLIAGMFTAILVNLTLLPVKGLLKIEDIKKGENDGFSRIRDTLVVLFASFYIVVTFAYIAYYYARYGAITIGISFYLPLFTLCIISLAVPVMLMALARYEYRIQIKSITGVVRDLAGENSDPDHRISILTFNELGEIAAYVNTILNNFASLLSKISSTGMTIAESTKQISSSSHQNAAYANEQAAAATEVVSTMEDVDTLSKEVGNQVRKVAEQSSSVKQHVQDGVSTIQQNLEQMNHVRSSYAQTIEGIRTLGEHIDGIWEIVKIINGIAGQIKIIAFNAALEASSAGDAGKNFEIVAGEIRRLADNTVDSTKEIKNRITEIEEASDKLIQLSEQDSGKIEEAWELSRKVEGLFSRILEASDTSAASAAEIQDSVDKQVNAFEQILITLRQISEGISEFTGSIDESSETAAALEGTAGVLKEIVERYGIREDQKDENPL